MKQSDDIKFVARHYRKDAFNPNDAWRRMGIAPTRRRWSAWRTAAAAALLLAFGATAGIMIYNNQQSAPEPQPLELTVRAIDFNSATLTQVVAEIHRVYGVEVTGLPANADSIIVTMHYEGSAASLITRLNETFDLKLSLK